MRIVIIGAGVAGCVMARRLSALEGVEVTCLERVSRDDHSEAGTGLNVGPNAVKALQAVDPELAARITAASFVWTNWRISLTDGTVLFDLPLKDVAEGPGWRIRWSELYRVLREAAGASVAYGCEITQIARDAADPRKTNVAWRQDGREHGLDGIDLLIAADGRYSDVRRTISGEVPVRLTGVAISRLLVPDTSRGLIDDYEQWFNGPNRLLAFRVPPDHVYLAGTFPIESEIPEARKAPDALRAAYTPAQAPPSDQARWLIDQLCNGVTDTHWARMQEHDLLYRAADCNVLYLGDAAHGMVPTLGQGATQAIEDAACAAALIAQRHQAGARDVARWLAEIEALRSDRMRFVMEFSLAASDTILAGGDPVAGTRKKSDEPFRNNLKALYRQIGLPIDGGQA
ncbi:FAD-dependent oxidoreductase [Bradyrhizobium sacchari]|uniref:Salicylate hydroxylase n=1 Tax=Bradyrhizobium sacchari TaxID=1399419 RepID=A0A560KN20_9BRAD|nr:NAD(P)/FAD-dependent oxidoreductase [Bradyrhizobium sacchari]OPY96543.1 FAD-dependent oxidoreductase [Bradyrhizobium sacchari]TWB67322.1 salicylate hydroxylase [Bradyrhizobium sacchari]TWB84559.1 salicylate hydroxylase [Bradyrhizobium sacchari]